MKSKDLTRLNKLIASTSGAIMRTLPNDADIFSVLNALHSITRTIRYEYPNIPLIDVSHYLRTRYTSYINKGMATLFEMHPEALNRIDSFYIQHKATYYNARLRLLGLDVIPDSTNRTGDYFPESNLEKLSRFSERYGFNTKENPINLINNRQDGEELKRIYNEVFKSSSTLMDASLADTPVSQAIQSAADDAISYGFGSIKLL